MKHERAPRSLTMVPIAATAILVLSGCGTSTPTSPPPAIVEASPTAGASPTTAITAAPSAPAPSPTLEASAPPPSPSVVPGTPPIVDPANFSAGVTNPWFPLVPGTTMRYRGNSGGESAREVVRITSATKMIEGVPCVVVHDTVYIAGKLAEDTFDYYAPDNEGNVWYFGEDTAEYNKRGRVVSTEGTWQAGVEGASAGIFMPADPVVGQTVQQEYFAGHAEDYAVVLFMDASVRVPYGKQTGVMVTGEWTPLEPGVVGEKWYGKDIGELKEADVVGGDESYGDRRVDAAGARCRR